MARKILTAGMAVWGIVYQALARSHYNLPHDLNLGANGVERFLQDARTALGLNNTHIGLIQR